MVSVWIHIPVLDMNVGNFLNVKEKIHWKYHLLPSPRENPHHFKREKSRLTKINREEIMVGKLSGWKQTWSASPGEHEQSVPRWTKRSTSMVFWPESTIMWPAGAEEWFFPCTWHWWSYISSAVFSSEPLTTRTLGCWSVCREGNKAHEGFLRIFYKPFLQPSQWFSLRSSFHGLS